MTIEKYQDADDLNYNLLCAYSRYFCKFIYDRYGQDKLAALYQMLRDKNEKDPTKQLILITSLLGMDERKLQSEWQLYVKKEEVPTRWQNMIPKISVRFRGDVNYVFAKSDAQ